MTLVTDREKLEATKLGMIADYEAFVKLHESNMAVIEHLMTLTEPDTGMFPSVFLDLMRKEFPSVLATKANEEIRPADPPSLEDAIYALMETGQDTYFTADKSWSPRQIYLMLESRGYPFPQGADAGINSVSTVLIRMMDKSILERTIKGSGRAPSLYRWIRAEDRPSSTARNYTHIISLSTLADQANVQGFGSFGGFSTDLYDATRSGIKGGYGTLPGFSTVSFDEFAKLKEKERGNSEEPPL